jgi:hypothetical protein
MTVGRLREILADLDDDAIVIPYQNASAWVSGCKGVAVHPEEGDVWLFANAPPWVENPAWFGVGAVEVYT